MGSPFFPTPLPHFDWDLTGISLPPYPEGLGALYRHVIEGGRGRKGGRERGQKIPSPYPQKFVFVSKKPTPLPSKNSDKIALPPLDMEPRGKKITVVVCY